MIDVLSHDVDFKKLGLATEENNVSYVQCLDPREPYTNGGTVIFETKREPLE